MRSRLLLFFAALSLPSLRCSAAEPSIFEKDSEKRELAAVGLNIFSKENLLAWCIVPFDAKKRGPEERAAMLEGLGLHRFAYDYRAEHIPTWDAELDALKRHHIELTAWWFPTTLNAEAKKALELFQRHGVHPQLWVMGGGAPTKDVADQQARIESEAARIRTIAEAAAPQGLTVGLYNHGGWFGVPENQLAVLERLQKDGVKNVGIVYNFHHGHGEIDRFAELFPKMAPHLITLNLNGMTRDGDKKGKGTIVIGTGECEAEMLAVVRKSGWRGPVGIINESSDDAEMRLRANLEGLEKLVATSMKELQAPHIVAHVAANLALQQSAGIPAAKPETLTKANGWPGADSFKNWERSLGGPTSNRYSGLTQIDKANVSKLVPAWEYHSKDGSFNIQCNPIVVDGVMFAPTAGWNIVALDATNGKELWRFTPERQGNRQEDVPARRGLLYWRGDRQSPARIIFTAGYWIYALDPKTGKLIDSFGKQGRTEIPAGGTAVGAVAQEVLVVPGFAGDVFGYDVRTGEKLWTFITKPPKGQPGSETWSKIEEGANCWGGMAMDESRGIAYVATGSPKPNFFGFGHLGDNLYSDCVLALQVNTGKLLWSFQEVRHDIWDWDIPAPPNLVTVERNGVKVDAVAQVTKLANTLLLDRVTGQPLYDIPLAEVQTKGLPGDEPAKLQPAIAIPQPFARQAFTLADVTKRTPEAEAAILPIVQRGNLGPYPSIEEAKPTVMFNIHGGAEWTGAAADPKGRLYVTANEIPWHITCFRDDDPPPARPATAGEQVYLQICAACHGPDRKGIAHAPPLRGVRHRLKEEDVRALLKTGRAGMPAQPQLTEEQIKPLLDFVLCRDRPVTDSKTGAWTFSGWNKLLDPEGYPGCTPPWGTLNCLDLNTGRIAWKVPLGEYPELTAKGIPKTGTENFGGAMVTAGGLVFASGTRDKMIRAFDADTGAELWSYPLKLHGTAPPACYEAGGRQFIVLPVTGGGKLGGPTGDAWVAFALPQS